MTSLRPGRSWYSLVAIILLAHTLLWLLLYPIANEDAYIYLRFAHNIAHGWGYVFNIGGERVESGTSPIWLALLVAAIKLHIQPVFAMKALGLLFSLLALLVAGELAFSVSKSTGARLLAMAPAAASYPLVFWADQGLETPMIAFLLPFLVLCLIDIRWRKWLTPTCIILVMARPEAVIYLSLVFAWGVGQRYDGTRGASGEMWRAIGLSLLALLLLTCWRVFYFGDFVAHPFYVKSSIIGDNGFISRLSEANRHLRLDLLLLPVVLAALLQKLPRRVLLLVLALLLQMVWFGVVSDHYHFERHLTPALPILYALFAIATAGLWRTRSRSRYLLCAGLVFLPCFAIVQYECNPLVQITNFFLRHPGSGFSSILHGIESPDAYAGAPLNSFVTNTVNVFALGDNWEVQPGRFIAAVYPRGTTVAYREMGQTPYYAGSDKIFIDTVGLVTRNVGYYRFGTTFAESPLAHTYWRLRCDFLKALRSISCPDLGGEAVVNYILDRKPDVIMVHRVLAAIYGKKLPLSMVLHDSRFKRLYRLRYVVEKYVDVYERADVHFPVFNGTIPGVSFVRAGEAASK